VKYLSYHLVFLDVYRVYAPEYAMAILNPLKTTQHGNTITLYRRAAKLRN